VDFLKKTFPAIFLKIRIKIKNREHGAPQGY